MIRSGDWRKQMSRTEGEENKREAPPHYPLGMLLGREIVFITVCTEGRARMLDTAVHHEVLRRVWGDSRDWMVGRYVVMPDHVHLFACPASWSPIPLKRWVGWWKRQSAIALGMGDGLWQVNFWDTRMRSAEHYAAKLSYVRENPVRHGLVRRAEEWEYAGVIHSIGW